MTTTPYTEEDAQRLLGVMLDAARAIARAGQRRWHRDLQANSKMHPILEKALRAARPDDWQLLLLEWPRESETTVARVVYTPSDAKGRVGQSSETTLGKYLTRHFSALADHQIRDLAALAQVKGCRFVHTTAEFVHAVATGPKSCMQKDSSIWPKDANGNPMHPYSVYDPEYGWHMAIREEMGEIRGRAMCMANDEAKFFVRSYRKTPSGSSPTDETLEAWLKEQGYVRYQSWAGCKISKISLDDETYLAPYIDGHTSRVDFSGEAGFISDDGAHECDNQDGKTSLVDALTCEECGDRVPDDAVIYVGYWQEQCVCPICLRRNYTYVTGRNGDDYYVPDRQAITTVEGDNYDRDYLAEHDVVELHTGDYTHVDNATYVESVDAYYHVAEEDDTWVYVHDEAEVTEDCVKLENGSWELEENAWECAQSGEWHSYDDTEPTELDNPAGGRVKVHPDCVDDFLAQHKVEQTT